MLAMYLLWLYSGEPLYQTVGQTGTSGLCIQSHCVTSSHPGPQVLRFLSRSPDFL